MEEIPIYNGEYTYEDYLSEKYERERHDVTEDKQS